VTFYVNICYLLFKFLCGKRDGCLKSYVSRAFISDPERHSAFIDPECFIVSLPLVRFLAF